MAQRPIHEIRMGAIKAVIWCNVDEQNFVRHNVVLQRLYKNNSEKEFRVSDSFNRDSLLIVARVAQKAADWIFENSKSHQPADASSTTPAAAASS